MKIANTTDRKEKYLILVESLASSFIGTGGGIIVGTFLITNPVGWGTALVLAAGTAAWSLAAGKIARMGYDSWNRPIDFSSGIGIGNLWAPLKTSILEIRPHINQRLTPASFEKSGVFRGALM